MTESEYITLTLPDGKTYRWLADLVPTDSDTQSHPSAPEEENASGESQTGSDSHQQPPPPQEPSDDDEPDAPSSPTRDWHGHQTALAFANAPSGTAKWTQAITCRIRKPRHMVEVGVAAVVHPGAFRAGEEEPCLAPSHGADEQDSSKHLVNIRWVRPGHGDYLSRFLFVYGKDAEGRYWYGQEAEVKVGPERIQGRAIDGPVTDCQH